MANDATKKPSKNRQPTDAPPARLADHPLYVELIAIGRRSRTIRPDALVIYSDLLATPEVMRRARDDDVHVRARAATQALLAAVDSIRDEADRKAAELALCASEDYEGESLDARLRMVPGLTEGRFKYHRHKAFAAIIEFLSRPSGEAGRLPPAVLPYSRRPPVLTEQDEIARGLSVLLENAANLHYVCLAVLCIGDLERFLWQHRIHWSQTTSTHRGRAPGERPLSRELFERVTRLLYRSHLVRLEHYLQHNGGTQIVLGLERLRETSPVGPRTIDMRRDELALTEAYVFGAESESKRLIEFRLKERDAKELQQAEENKGTWAHWYLTVWDKTSRGSPLLPLTSVTGYLTRQLARFSGVSQQHVARHGIRLAAKTVSLYYDKVEEDLPLVGTAFTLRDRVETYVELESAILTSRYRMWDSGDIDKRGI